MGRRQSDRVGSASDVPMEDGGGEGEEDKEKKEDEDGDEEEDEEDGPTWLIELDDGETMKLDAERLKESLEEAASPGVALLRRSLEAADEEYAELRPKKERESDERTAWLEAVNAATTVAQLSDALESFADRLFAQRHLLSEAADEAAEQPDADGGEGGEGGGSSKRKRKDPYEATTQLSQWRRRLRQSPTLSALSLRLIELEGLLVPRHEMLAGRRVQVWFANDAKKEGGGAGAGGNGGGRLSRYGRLLRDCSRVRFDIAGKEGTSTHHGRLCGPRTAEGRRLINKQWRPPPATRERGKGNRGGGAAGVGGGGGARVAGARRQRARRRRACVRRSQPCRRVR